MATTTRPFGAIQSAGEETWRSVVDLTPKQLARLKHLMKAQISEAKQTTTKRTASPARKGQAS